MNTGKGGRLSESAGQADRTGDVTRPGDYGFSEFQPRLWHGMTLRPWLGLARGNWGRITPRRYPLAASITLAAAGSSLLAAINRAGRAGRAARQPLAEAPVFVLGFWRSGTTLLNEMLVSDPRFVSPTTFQCMTPETFALLSPIAGLVERMLPGTRPMDSMDFKMDSPQEDEFAILNLGLQTPYRYMAFPSIGVGPQAQARYWPQSEGEWQAWIGKWQGFLRCVAQANPGKRLVLKSPPHTGRIARLLAEYPDAKFVHISRQPGPLYASNLKMNKAMAATQSLEATMQDDQQMEDGIMETHDRIYSSFFAERDLIPAGQYCELRYEELISEPEREILRIYEEIGLGDPSATLDAVRVMMQERSGYRAGSYELEPRLRQRIETQWRAYLEAFGYESA